MIRFENVSKIYDKHPALKGITFLAGKGEMLFITGPSGAGKSTLLKLIYHAVEPDEGTITIAGQGTSTIRAGQIPYLRRMIGVVFQDFRLLTRRTVFENTALALRIRGLGDQEIKNSVMETLKLVGLRHKSDVYPESLSGGEQQRVVIARALVAEPMLLLADEPTGNLDQDTSMEILRIFKDINARGTTVLIATHNTALYAGSSKRVLRLEEGALAREDLG